MKKTCIYMVAPCVYVIVTYVCMVTACACVTKDFVYLVAACAYVMVALGAGRKSVAKWAFGRLNMGGD